MVLVGRNLTRGHLMGFLLRLFHRELWTGGAAFNSRGTLFALFGRVRSQFSGFTPGGNPGVGPMFFSGAPIFYGGGPFLGEPRCFPLPFFGGAGFFPRGGAPFPSRGGGKGITVGEKTNFLSGVLRGRGFFNYKTDNTGGGFSPG